MGRFQSAAADPVVVTAADMVAGHVTLDISCLDRVYLNGYVAKLQTPGAVVYFFHDHRGKPIVSPALFEPIGEKFRRDIKDWAQANGIPVIRFGAGERKAEVMAPYLDAAAAAGCSQVVAIGCAQEFQLVWTARKRATDPVRGRGAQGRGDGAVPGRRCRGGVLAGGGHRLRPGVPAGVDGAQAGHRSGSGPGSARPR